MAGYCNRRLRDEYILRIDSAPEPRRTPVQPHRYDHPRFRRRAVIAFFMSAVAFIVSIVMFTPGKPATATASATSAVAQREADDLGVKKAEEEAKCAADVRCVGEKKMIEASFRCAPLMERLAQNSFEWTDRWYEPKLSHYRWADQNHQVVTYSRDKIKYQNGFGAWVLSKYECDYNVALGAAIDVRASPGRLPLD
jgi:hypothetical protein